ncbi:hypothetical protein D3C72_2335410 [compost metagenome]
MVRQRTEDRVVAEEAQDQRMAVREIGVDSTPAVQRTRVQQQNISGLRSPGEDVVGIGIDAAFGLDVRQPRPDPTAVQRLGRVVGVLKGAAVVARTQV